MAGLQDAWTLRQTPFAARLHQLLKRVRKDTNISWLAIVDHFHAPAGDLVPTWRSVSPGPAPDPLSSDEVRELRHGRLDPFPGPATDHRSAHLIPIGPGFRGPPPLLLIAADEAPATAHVQRLLSVLGEGLTSQRRAETTERIAAAVEDMPDPLEITDRNGRLVYANRAWAATFGHDPDQQFGATVAHLFRKRDAPVHDTSFYQFTMSTIQEGGAWLGALACRTASGDARFAEAHVGPFSAPRFEGNVAVRRDLSHRAGRDEALAKAHYEFRRVLSALPDGATVLREGRIYYANPAFLRMVGAGEAEVVGRPYEELVHPDDRSRLREQERGHAVRVRIIRADAPPRIAEISTPGFLSFEGQPARILMSRDVTDDRIKAEMLARAERLSALGSLAAGLAHEINNPLAYLTLSLYELRDTETRSLDGAGRRLLSEAIDGAERIQRVVKELRAFSGQEQADTPQLIDLSMVITSALNIAQNEIRHRATLVRRLDDRARVLAREGPLVQVMVSLLVNAAQAIPEGDGRRHEITVDVRSDDDDVCIEVRDTGIGIPADVLPRVFDPFFTSKPRNEGSGLGLFIARRIIEEFGGRIEVYSPPGSGTTALVRLPRAAGSAKTPVPEVVADAATGGDPVKILIVDDEPQVVRALSRVLRAYRVETAETWDAAIEVLKSKGPFDVVLCDLMMPGQSGPELYQQAVTIYPQLSTRFLFMTGGAFADGVPKFLTTWQMPVVTKPFVLDQLKARIRDVADGKYDSLNSGEE